VGENNMSLWERIKCKQESIAVVGLGYVGFPLAVEFGKMVNTIGFDLNQKRIKDLQNFTDTNKETSTEEIKAAKFLEVTSDPARIKEAKFIVVAVPTPITKNRQPDLYCLESASELVGKNLSKGSIVVFESTVYPGVTEDVCVPILEKFSGAKRRFEIKGQYNGCEIIDDYGHHPSEIKATLSALSETITISSSILTPPRSGK